MGVVFAEKGTYVDTVKFIQYLEESTALEEVKKGNLDMYYSRMPSELLQDGQSAVDVFYVTGGSFSILVNPAPGERFNPFSFQQVRFALNYLVDRNLIVDELMGGHGIQMISNYGPFDPDYLLIVEELEQFHFRYNPELARQIITKTLEENGAEKVDGRWMFAGAPIEVTVFIRNDDSVRKSIGEVLSSELEMAGFAVRKDFGDLNKAFVVVYGSDPAEHRWHLYTEGYAGRSAFVKYDSLGLAQMYAPWFSNMPGLNNPTYWNYENDKLDQITQQIYSANFTSSHERAELIRAASKEGVTESVRIFLAAKIDPFVANPSVDGVINDFGGGITSRFTPINSRTGDGDLLIGVKQIYQGAWNPVRGLSDAYSKNIWDILYDPGIFKHPYSGENIPVREFWEVETAGPSGTVDVPEDALIWSTADQTWANVGKDTKATSKITYDLVLGSWHHGVPMDMNDVLYSVYFGQEWASTSGQDDKTFDPEFSPQASQGAKTLVGVRPLDGDTVEVYVNYWHFDQSEIADWGGVWVTLPWEVFFAMEQAVIDGKTSFSRTDAQAKNLSWLSLIVPKDAALVGQYLEEFREKKTIPPALAGSAWEYYDSRYGSASAWVSQKRHAVISNGPFYLEGYSPEARVITARAFDDPMYPLGQGHWSEFETVAIPKITGISVPDIIVRGSEMTIPIWTQDASTMYYFVTDAHGVQVDSGALDVSQNAATLVLSEQDTGKLAAGALDLKFYALSEYVLRPDIYATSLLVVDSDGVSSEEVLLSRGADDGGLPDNTEAALLAVGISVIVIAAYAGARMRAKRRTEL